MKVTVDVEVPLTPAVIAAAFCDMNDEKQAQFFIEVGRIASTWTGRMGTDWQWSAIGKHLRDCGCSTPEARSVIAGIAYGLSAPPGGGEAP